jgi:hypothetical protein
MNRSKLFTCLALAAATVLPVAAQDSYSRPYYNGNADAYAENHELRRDMRHDWRRVQRMRDHIARDRARLDEDIRCGRDAAAARDARDLARDQQALDYQLRDIQRDRQAMYGSYYRR